MTAARQSAPTTSTRSNGETTARRANKPLMEKRRRARINQSLAVLKSLILDSARLENTKHSKLEKADILELTVRHLQRQRALGPGALTKYRAGFSECTREVSRFLEVEAVTTSPDEAPSLKARLLRHLQSCSADLEAEDAPIKSEKVDESVVEDEEEEEVTPELATAAGDENNNNGIENKSTELAASPLLSVVQVVPSRLPDGQLVFLLPSHYVQLAAWAARSTSTLPALPSPPPHSPRCRPSIDTEEIIQESPLDCSRRASTSPVPAPVPGVDEQVIVGPVWRPWDTLDS